jgi:polyphenol oxidase
LPFRLDERGVYRCEDWEQFPWLEHGFGTRLSDGWLPAAESADLKQIHSEIIVRADAPASRFCEGDALVTNHPGLWVRIRTADCLPVLFVDPHRRAVAAAHCGWRGVRLGLAAATLRRMHEEFGPGIGPCCFEVGPEVAAEFRDAFPERNDLDRKTHLDLTEALLRQLEQAGIDRARVTTGRLCTRCDGERFHSFRRDRERAGRMESGIRLKG